jgi:hypothetical protein
MSEPNEFEGFPWIAPWQAISYQGKEAYELELRREVTPGHPLYDVNVQAVARTCNDDEILFYLPDHPAQLAVVHLTFTGRPERESRWPHVTLYKDTDHWVTRRMIPDVARFEIDPHREAA